MRHLDIYKKLWAYSTIFFILNYSFYLFLFIVKIPLYPFPNILNIISLTLSYSIGLRKIKNICKLAEETNFYCILVFLTFPRSILLFPFYLLGIYNLMSLVLSNKKIFEKSFIFVICMSCSTLHVLIGRLALMSEILCLLLNIAFFIFRLSSVGNLVTYCAMVRQQYLMNQNMKSVVNEMKIKLDLLVKYLPDTLQKYYLGYIKEKKRIE